MCISLLEQANTICENFGEGHQFCKSAWLRYAFCESARAERMSDTTADDRMIALQKFLEDAYAAMFEKLDLDIPPTPCGMASLELKAKLFANQESAMIFSNKLAEAFKDAKLELAENETFTCFICATNKPQTVTEALALDPLGVKSSSSLPVNYVMEPAIMKSVMKRIEKDKINYGALPSRLK